MRGHELSPIKHLYLKSSAGSRSVGVHTKIVNILDDFVDKVITEQDFFLYFLVLHANGPANLEETIYVS